MNAITPPTVDINKRIDQYVQLRALIKEKDDAHKKEMAPFRDTLEQLNSALLAHLNNLNVDNASGASGTVYRTTKASASVADMTAFWTFIVASGNWDLLDKKANVTAVKAFLDEKGQLPPGVNYNTVDVVGVRKA